MIEAKYLSAEMVAAIKDVMERYNISRNRLSHKLCMSYITVTTALNRTRKATLINVEKFVSFLKEYGVEVENPVLDDPL